MPKKLFRQLLTKSKVRSKGEKTQMGNEELEAQLKRLQTDFAGFCKLFAIQQQALETLGETVEKHQRVMEIQVGYQAPDPRRATEN
jgi:hypothetical protein